MSDIDITGVKIDGLKVACIGAGELHRLAGLSVTPRLPPQDALPRCDHPCSGRGALADSTR